MHCDSRRATGHPKHASNTRGRLTLLALALVLLAAVLPPTASVLAVFVFAPCAVLAAVVAES